MKRLALIIIVAAGALFNIAGQCQEPKFKIAIDVKAEDESMKYLIRSLMGRELRKIEDATIVDEGEDFRIFIAVQQISYESGRSTKGYSMAFVFTKTNDAYLDILIGMENITVEQQKILSALKDNMYRGTVLYNTDIADINSTIVGVAAGFDVTCLEPMRR